MHPDALRRRRAAPLGRQGCRGAARSCARCSTAATSIAPPRRGRGSASPCWSSPSVYAHHRRAAGDVRGGARQPQARRALAQDAVATARPDILDRNGEILATDVRAPSLFAEPRRIIDVDEAVELLTAVLPDLDAMELRERLASKRAFRLAQARHHAGAAGRDLPARPARHRLPDREQARLSERQRGLARDRPRQYRQPGHRRHREVARRQRPRRPAHGGARHRPPAGAGRARGRPARAARAARRTDAARDKFKAKAAAGIVSTCAPARSSRWCRSRTTIPNNPREALDPTRINRLTTGVYEMGSTFKAFTIAMALDSGKVDAQLDVRRARAAALRQVRHPRLPRREPRC